MRVGITGGAGFIGSNLCRKLLSEGYQVSVLDDFSTGLRSNLRNLDVNVIEGSIIEKEVVRKFFEGLEAVVHLAARGSVPRSLKNPVATHEINVGGTIQILEFCRKTNIPIIFSSSSSVYGRNLTLPKVETQWTAPLSPYAASKSAGEVFVNAYGESFGLPSLVLRFFNVYGPWQRPDHDYAAVLPKWIWAAMNDKPIELHGDGTQTRDFTFVSTPVEIIFQAISRKIVHPTPINLAYGNKISLLEVIEFLRDEFPNLEVKNCPARTGDVKNSQNDPTLLKAVFPNLQPPEFKESLIETINWLSDNAGKIINGPKVED